MLKENQELKKTKTKKNSHACLLIIVLILSEISPLVSVQASLLEQRSISSDAYQKAERSIQHASLAYYRLVERNTNSTPIDLPCAMFSGTDTLSHRV